MTAKTPTPLAVRRSVPPPPTPVAALSPPFSAAPLRAPLGAAAVAGAGASSSSVDQPCVRLLEWWLARVERDDRKLAVSGFTEKNYAFTSAPIAKRYEPLTIEDEDGVVMLLIGWMSVPRMRENGFSAQICEKFMIGFPFWWETWDSHMENFPNFFINPREGSSQFYLQKFQLDNYLESLGPSFIQDLLKDAKNNTFNEVDTCAECSRFEECACGSDIAAEGSNDARPALAANEVDNVETHLIASSPLQQTDNVDIHCDPILGPTETCTSDETCEETGNQDETCEETGNQNDTVQPDGRELEAGSQLLNSSLIFSRSPYFMPSDLEDGSTSAGNSEDLVSKRLLAAVPPEKANFCTDIVTTSQPLCYQSTPVASLKNQVCLERTELITASQKAVPNEDTSTPVHSDAQSLEIIVGQAEKQRSAEKLWRTPARSPRARSPILYAHHLPLTRARAHSLSISTPESLKMKKTKSGRLVVPPLDPGSQMIVYKDGMISGVSPVSQSPLKGSAARKRKRRAL